MAKYIFTVRDIAFYRGLKLKLKIKQIDTRYNFPITNLPNNHLTLRTNIKDNVQN